MSKRASRQRRLSTIEAAAPVAGPFYLQGDSGRLEIEANAADATKPKRFSIVGYTGGAMDLGRDSPVVVDIAGTRVSRQDIPILRQHDPERIVAHTDSVDTSAQRIKLSGLMSGVGAAAEEVRSLAANGFPWQASIGASVEKMEFVERGETVKVNGRNFTGPIYVARATTLREVSFVPIGADTSTSASVAAHYQGGKPMFEKWLTAKGFDPAALTETQKTALQAAYDAEQKPAPKPEAKAEPIVAAKVPAHDDAADIQASRDRRVAESLRVESIARICAKYGSPRWAEADGTGETSLEAKAIAAGWTEKETHLEALLRDKGTGGAPNFFMASQKRDNVKPDVLECSLAVSRGLPNVEKQYKAETLEAAHKHFRNMGLQQLFLTAAAANGYHVGPGTRISNGNIRDVLHAAMPNRGIQAAGFSTVPLPNILGNVANKELLAGYMEEDQTWREIGGVKTVNNFHAVTSYRMLDDMTYEKLGPAGEIVHGKVSEESYTRQADSYAKMFALTRKDIVNDDLSAFDDLRGRLGRGSAIKFNDVFWTEFMSDAATFWTTARTNYITGATTTLLTDGVGLGLGVKAFRVMASPTADGSKRISGRPEILLVPPELEQAAEMLFVNTNLATASAVLSGNIYAAKYRPVVCPWLSDTAFTGNSTTAWYLLRSPSIMPSVVVSFLNGMQTPTVESAEADFNTLGVQFRGYHDFGVDQAEYLCGIKSKGAA